MICCHVDDFLLAGDEVFDQMIEILRKKFSAGKVGEKLFMRQSACLVFNYAAFFNCTPVGRASDSMMAPT